MSTCGCAFVHKGPLGPILLPNNGHGPTPGTPKLTWTSRLTKSKQIFLYTKRSISSLTFGCLEHPQSHHTSPTICHESCTPFDYCMCDKNAQTHFGLQVLRPWGLRVSVCHRRGGRDARAAHRASHCWPHASRLAQKLSDAIGS